MRVEIEDDIHAFTRGFDEVRALDISSLGDEGYEAKIPLIPSAMAGNRGQQGNWQPG